MMSTPWRQRQRPPLTRPRTSIRSHCQKAPAGPRTQPVRASIYPPANVAGRQSRSIPQTIRSVTELISRAPRATRPTHAHGPTTCEAPNRCQPSSSARAMRTMRDRMMPGILALHNTQRHRPRRSRRGGVQARSAPGRTQNCCGQRRSGGPRKRQADAGRKNLLKKSPRPTGGSPECAFETQ
jgi:hypothetical protein